MTSVLLRHFIFSASADIFLRSKEWKNRDHEKKHVLGYSEKQEQIYVNTFILLASQLSYKMETSTYFNRENDNISYFMKDPYIRRKVLYFPLLVLLLPIIFL